MKLATFASTLILATTLAPATLAADEKSEPDDSPFSLELEMGIEYDSNVAVLELDASSGESDLAATIDLGLGVDQDLSDRVKFNVGYDFSQSLHEEFDTLDIRIHRASAGLEADLGGVTAGVSAQYADATLDDDGFLVLQQITPSLSRLFGKKVFVRLGYTLTEKEFDTAPGRDADAESPSVDLFVFQDGVRRYVSLGYRHHDEDAVDDQFDYSGGTFKVQFHRRWTRGSREIKFKAETRYEFRDYEAASLIFSEPREDDRYKVQFEWEVPLTERTYLAPRLEYADYSSNLSSVDFDEQVAAVRFGVRL